MPDFGEVIDNAARSDNINQSGLVLDIEPRTAELDPDSYTFEALTRELGNPVIAKRTKHEFRERRLIPNYTVVTDPVTAGDSAINVASFDRIKNDFLLYVPSTEEMLLVQDTSIDSSVTVVRAATGTGTIANDIAAGAKVCILGEAHAEGEAIPSAYTNVSVDQYDYVMQKDRVVQVTDIEEAIEHYDDREKRALDRKMAWIEYKRDTNLLYYVGQKSREVTSAGGPRRHVCSGAFEKFTENKIDLSSGDGGLTFQTLANIMGETTIYGSSSKMKIGIFGTNGWQAISAWPMQYLRVSPKAKEWGVMLNRILTGYGPMDVGFDPVLTAQKGLEDRGIIIDPAWVRRIYIQKMKPRMFLDVSNQSDIHNIKDCISGTFAMQAKFDELHAQIEGIS